MSHYVTAVRYSNNEISNVLLHNPGGEQGRLSKGRVVGKSEIIRLIRNGSSVKTAIYNYTYGIWNQGAEISIAQNGPTVYLRTQADGTVRDNLGNLPLIDELF